MASGNRKWEMDKETKGSLGKGCKRRTMHHVTINQKMKREDKKKNNLAKKIVSQRTKNQRK
jgi:hypothetical protein